LTSIILLIGIVIAVTAITLLYAFMSNVILINEEVGPKLSDPHKQSMEVEAVVNGLSFPTSMEFIDNENILVLEKDHGTVHLVSLNGILEKKPVLKLEVENEAERGLLGVAISKDNNAHTKKYSSDNNDSANTELEYDESIPKVFLYFTEKPEDGNENRTHFPRNTVLSYEWNKQNKSLVNSKLVLDLPSEPGPYHQGGKLKIGPDGNLYVVIGDLNTVMGQLQNHRNGTEPNNSSVILRINPNNGGPAQDNPFVGIDIDGLSRYYAYGIRNSFGIDFDPMTGNLWDTENGEESYDEINLVKPGFNSGWAKMMGPVIRNNLTDKESLYILPGSEYADPVFSWKEQVGVTDIEFFNSSKLGTEYANNIFVGDINNGSLYFFKLNENRTGINFVGEEDENRNDSKEAIQKGLQQDFVADNKDELSKVIFGTDFGRITDIETGPDGFLYILSYEDGRIYRIVNK
jgi:aldose sugar dehydrogenase